MPRAKQIKAVFTEKYWWMIILFYVLWQFSGTMKNSSMTYFANYIAGTYSDGITQSVLALIGGIPMALGLVITTPLAKRLGKRNFTVLGLLIGALGGVIMLLDPKNIWIAGIGLAVKGLGMIPGMYIMMALFADVLDHMEWKNGFRCDGLSMSIYAAVMVAVGGVCTGTMNAMLSAAGYTAPDTVHTVLAIQKIVNGSVVYIQNPTTQNVISACYIGFELVCWVLAAVVLLFLNVEKNLSREQNQILQREKM